VERHVTGFLRSSLLWLVIGTSLGAAMASHPGLLWMRPAHLHALLLGFVMMMIAGVAYHIIPRFALAALHAPRLARAHLVLANLGVSLMVAGFLLRGRGLVTGPTLLAAGGMLSLLGAWAFAWNIWRTLDAAVPTVVTLRSRGS
jgi:cbb3-type cytochrome oxidase subunit 1